LYYLLFKRSTTELSSETVVFFFAEEAVGAGGLIGDAVLFSVMLFPSLVAIIEPT